MKMKLIVLGANVLLIALGLCEGNTPPCDGTCLEKVARKIIEDEDPTILDKIKAKMSAANIDANLRDFTKDPHLAGTPGDDALADELHRIWTEQGMDHVTKVTYDVLLSYPNQTDLSRIYLLGPNDTVIYATQEVEKVLSPDQNRSDIVPPFNAYAKSGDVEGELIYVNYGRIEDFTDLMEKYGVNATGKIAMARYGMIFRGEKVSIAADHGAIGVILYSDPADYLVNTNGTVYPNSWWLPGTGVQRGSVMIGQGDPLTPGYPSTETAYRIPHPDLPTIPSHPIGYEDAYQFLSRMSGPYVESSWQGGLNFTYRIGPGFTDKNLTTKLHVTTYNKRVNTSNVFAYINGSVEPDRYVLLGNHRDAWVFGAVDPTSGTSVMMEVSRVLAEIVKEGIWRPRRTIIFCSWGAEEYGVVNSYEWVEDHVKILSDRAVVYFNVDIAVEGMESMRAKGVPLLYSILHEVAKRIPSANNDNLTLYDEWLRYFPDKERDPSVPMVHELGGGSDFGGFIGFAGVPSMDVRYTYNYTLIDYPLYHSVYETYDLVKNHMDPELKRSLAIGLYWAEIARAFADPLILPFNASTYSEMMNIYISDLEGGYGELLRANNVSLNGLYDAGIKFELATHSFMDTLTQVNRQNPIEMRMYNDQLMRLERAFISFDGLPLRPLKKHVLFAPSVFDSYAGATFPGLVDLMHGIEKLEGEEKVEQWEKVKKHLATIIFCIDSATYGLKPWTSFD